MAQDKPCVGGKYLEFRGKPLVRQGDTICYGDMDDKYILILEIMSYKEVNGTTVPTSSTGTMPPDSSASAVMA